VNEELHIKRSDGLLIQAGHSLVRGKPFVRLEVRRLKPEAKKEPLLKMRDGPRGRAPATGFPVSLITNHFVSLCVYFVYIVVNEIKLVIRYQSHTRQHRAMINLRKNKDFSLVLHGVCPAAGEKFSFF